MASRARSLNDTTFGIPTMPASTFPQFKKPMPPDERSKLLAMHRAGRVNAGIYVAIVLAIYLLLLTLLLCRYSRKHRSHVSGAHNYCFCCSGFDEERLNGPFDWIRSLSACFGAGAVDDPPKKRRNSPEHPIEENQATQQEAIKLIDKTSTGAAILPRHDTEEVKPVVDV